MAKATQKKTGRKGGEVRGRIQARRRSTAAYARRADDRVAGEIDRRVSEAAQVREQIIAKIDRGLTQKPKGAETVGAAVRRKRRQ